MALMKMFILLFSDIDASCQNERLYFTDNLRSHYVAQIKRRMIVDVASSI